MVRKVCISRKQIANISDNLSETKLSFSDRKFLESKLNDWFLEMKRHDVGAICLIRDERKQMLKAKLVR